MLKSLRAIISKRDFALDLLVVAALAFIGGFLYKNVEYFPVPNQDFLGFIRDGNRLLDFTIPQGIKHPPIYSLAVVLLGKIINHSHPEQVGGIYLNILLYLMTLFMLWKLLKRYLGNLVSLLTVTLIVTNPLSYYVVLQPLNIVSFSATIVLVMLMRQKKYYKFAYLIAGLGYLVRFESILLILTMAFVDLFATKKKKETLKLVLISTIPILIWEILIYSNNIHGNSYLREILQRKDEIPNWSFLKNTFRVVPFNLNPYQVNLPIFIAISLIYSMLGILVAFLKRKINILIFFLFLMLYSFLHLFFPDSAKRYSYPVLWITYVASLWPVYLLSRDSNTFSGKLAYALSIFIVTTAIIVVSHNFIQIESFLKERRYHRFESVIIAEWVSNQKLEETTKVLTFEPSLVRYFTKRNQFSYIYVPSTIWQKCTKIDCLFSELSTLEDRDLLVVIDSYTQGTTLYMDKQNGINFFNNFESSAELSKYNLIAELNSNGKWVRIYKGNVDEI